MLAKAEPIVELARVSKWFGPTRALDRVSFDLRSGEVHVLAGENGAGKSTLIRILSGAYADFSGNLLIDGCSVRFRHPVHAARAGIATIHQELSLVGSMSVADNLFLMPTGFRLQVPRRRKLDQAARRVLEQVGLQLDPGRRVESLPLGQRQLVEIARALARHARVLIMDEPTSALSETEADRLFSRVLALRDQGTAIIYISHRMEEIYRVADRITVLRDGAVVTTAAADALDRHQLVAKIAGRQLARSDRSGSVAGAAPALSVRGLTLPASRARRPLLSEVTFSVRQGEILGLAGLEGSGRSELLHAVFGSLGPLTAGQVALDPDRPFRPSPERSIARGMVLLGSDRHQTVLAALSVVCNASLASLQRFSRCGWMLRGGETRAVEQVAKRLKLDAPSLHAAAEQLSGGNQQKVVLARCLLTGPRVLLLDEPTRGVDVGAKADIYVLLRELSRRQVAIVLVASELDELTELSHRILVMANGRIAAEYSAGDYSRRQILQAAMGHEGNAA